MTENRIVYIMTLKHGYIILLIFCPGRTHITPTFCLRYLVTSVRLEQVTPVSVVWREERMDVFEVSFGIYIDFTIYILKWLIIWDYQSIY